ncbi:MAG: type II/IV secretion system protein [Verrucomicrobia bacterium]|nr:type II/IV secretion system protein [Verrucomicrobiota bacterium]
MTETPLASDHHATAATLTAAPATGGRAELVARMVESRQLSAMDATALEELPAGPETEEEILQWLAGEYGLAYTALENVDPDRAILARFPARILLREEMLPLRQENGHVEVALSRLFAAPGLDSLKAFTDLKLQPVLAPSAALQREIKKHLGVGADTLNLLEQEEGFQVLADEHQDEGDLDKAAEDASIIRFVNQILGDAVSMRTSDIHVEPFEHELRIRYRIDGLLQEVPVPGQIKRFQPAIVSRIKILSNLNIAEKRVPQDGRIKIRVKGSDVDIRVSVIPMLHGEAVVMRLLRQDAGLVALEKLGMDRRDSEHFSRVLEMPHGIALVTGPTGSGKTTTLYAALNQINDSVRKIITIEDPVEYQLRGINQIQVAEKAGLTFARGLRAILRHDPDVVLIGEIRDQETAQIAVQASLTGHMVFSTLHTNDAPGALTRLVDMGVEPYLVASSLEAVMAQRLVRKLCPLCKEEDTTVRTRQLRQRVPAIANATLYGAVGCRECRMTGYTGRQALFELMTMSPAIREVLLRGGSSLEVKEVARREGMRTLIEDGWRLVREGITTPAEVLRVSKDEDASFTFATEA